MKRLFAFGCSFTMYAWPTYADILGMEFDHYENWGFPGLGNRAIAQRVAECNAKNKFTKDDTIIVQWTTHIRHDWHTFKEVKLNQRGDPVRNTDETGWKTKGSIFNYMNREICFDDNWLNNFWSEESYYMYGQNNIVLVRGLLDSIGCNYKMLSISDMNKLGTDMPDAPGFGEKTQEKINVLDTNPTFSVYNRDDFLEPLGIFAWNRQDQLYSFYDPNTKKDWTELHPSHWHHFDYYKEIIRPSLKLTNKIPDKIQYTMNKLDTLKETNKDLISFEEGILKEIVEYSHIGYIGY
jgi:hypothetical protein